MSMLVLALILPLACGDKEDDGDGFGGGGEGGDPIGGGADAGEEDGFVWAGASCEGDGTEYTWVYEAELSFAANIVTVTVEPGDAHYEAWPLQPVDAEQTLWAVEVTELLSSRSCDTPGHLLWEAFGFGEWYESLENVYP